jgi:hypothetical protein
MGASIFDLAGNRRDVTSTRRWVGEDLDSDHWGSERLRLQAAESVPATHLDRSTCPRSQPQCRIEDQFLVTPPPDRGLRVLLRPRFAQAAAAPALWTAWGEGKGSV